MLNTSTSTEAADAAAVADGAEAVGGVEDDGDAEARRRAPRRVGGGTGAPKTCVAMTHARPLVLRAGRGVGDVDLQRRRNRTRPNTGRSPFHATACAVAENVKLGSTTGPSGSSACSASMSPAVHDDTATTWRHAEKLGRGAGLELLDERPVGEHAAIPRRAQRAP